MNPVLWGDLSATSDCALTDRVIISGIATHQSFIRRGIMRRVVLPNSNSTAYASNPNVQQRIEPYVPVSGPMVSLYISAILTGSRLRSETGGPALERNGYFPKA